ncbi:hypothetical protein Acsp03_56780 [Actinomadura sp. NBRC 104412]|uniref:hypothetical protein n=1 Tax=Actinomadura sp. NBRC 104412 TaxID=3032203 RepID=UPI0024A4A911|nr:hypothetical protein [Actinomadura sp. NBRC 104412]GLZ08212.1 hypothetical protein Acsp03_56780 [Actinomadura sp. NBRC 104412]
MATTLSLTSMTTSDLAQILFASPLQPSDEPSPERVRKAIDESLCACGGDSTRCAAYVAQEAGDHPEAYAIRMRWALRTVSRAFQEYATAA